MYVEIKMIVKNDTNICSILGRADGPIIDDREFLKDRSRKMFSRDHHSSSPISLSCFVTCFLDSIHPLVKRSTWQARPGVLGIWYPGLFQFRYMVFFGQNSGIKYSVFPEF